MGTKVKLQGMEEMKTFTCCMCGYVGECRPEEEAEAELKSEFGDVNKEDCDVVCDDCWEKVRPCNNPIWFDKCMRFHNDTKGKGEE